MLKTIGVAKLETCWPTRGQRPAEASLNIPAPLSEPELMGELECRRSTASQMISFLGAGAYDHFIPPAWTRWPAERVRHRLHALSGRGQPGTLQRSTSSRRCLRADRHGGGQRQPLRGRDARPRRS